MRLLPLTEVAGLMGVSCEEKRLVDHYAIDSREVGVGGLFFALSGDKVDGHLFLQEVAQKGALGAVVEKRYNGPHYGLVLLKVESPKLSLQELARVCLVKYPALIVGVTGSVGKTTTKEFISTLLEGKYRIGKSPRSYNTKVTLPLSVLQRTSEEVMVLEMGMSEPDDLKKLVQIAPPHIAVLTRVGLSHAAFFPGGIAEIAKGKSQIFGSSQAVFDHQLYQFSEAIESIKGEKTSFSIQDSSADYFLSSSGRGFVIDEKGVRKIQLNLPFQQTHFLHNLLAAFVVARKLKMDWNLIEQRIPFLAPPSMRFEGLLRKGVFWINDAYNANPESMKAALSNLPSPKGGGQKIAVLGVMKELGTFSKNAHQEIGQFAQHYVDHLLVLGEEAFPLYESFSATKKKAEFFVDLNQLKERLSVLVNPGDVVLVKGSRSMNMETLLDNL